jgi:putative membrane protein
MRGVFGPYRGPFLPGHGGYEGAFILGTVLRFVALVLIIAAIVYLVRAFLQSRQRAWTPPGPSRSPALDELDMRYARGEVTRDEYFARRADLMGAAPPAPPAAP